MRKILTWLLFFSLFMLACGNDTQTVEQPKEKEILYVGTYSVRSSEGVYVYAFDREKRSFELIETATGPDSPSFLDISPDGRFLYTANRQGIGTDSLSGSVSAYRIDPASGKLELLNEASSYGISPCHIYSDEDHLYLSHYGGGSISVLSLKEDGSIRALVDTVQHTGHGPNKTRQEAAHLHSIQKVPNTAYFLAADLGIDALTFYQIKGDEVVPAPIPAIKTEAGAGPRHFTFSPDGHFLYVAEELSSSVSVYSLDPANRPTSFLQRLPTLPVDFSDQNTVADIHLSPDGKFLYVSNRGHDSLAIYRVDPSSGTLELVGHQPVMGKTPRNFMIDPQGTFLLVANQDTDDIIFFQRDVKTGLLEATDIRISVPSPVCLRMLML